MRGVTQPLFPRHEIDFRVLAGAVFVFGGVNFLDTPVSYLDTAPFFVHE